MADGDVAKALQFAEAFNEQDWQTIEALSTDDVEFWTFLQGRTEQEPLRGREGIRKWRESEDEALETRRLDSIAAREVAPGLVVLTAMASGRWRMSGIELAGEAAFLFEFREGKVARWRSFPSHEEAFTAARSAAGRD
jgi:ketosteroid isomerase-like protein